MVSGENRPSMRNKPVENKIVLVKRRTELETALVLNICFSAFM